MRNYLKLGSWNTICDVCGFKFKAEDLRKDWRGLMTCPRDFELRNPQDFIRVPPEKIVPPWVRPNPPDIFTAFCTLYSVQAISGQAVAGCMIAGHVNPLLQ